jgi:threonine dehydrogenase-like Zn-dependent dehydrogenase
MALRDQAEPSPQPGEALLKVAYAGICGSELSGYLGHNALRVPPLVMGHEFAGEIVALDDTAAEQRPGLRVGQRVTANPMWYCGSCQFCTRGQTHLCVNRRLIGAHRPGAYAEYVSVPAELIVPLPDQLSLRAGALAEPVAVAMRIGEVAGEVAGETVLVMGAGPIGLLALQVLRAKGAREVFIADLDAARLEMAAELGGTPLDPRKDDVVKAVRAATDGLGAPVTIDAVGAAPTRAACVGAARSAGTFILSGLHEETGPMPAAEIIRREITVRGCFCYTQPNFDAAVEALTQGAIKLDPWIVEAPLGDGGKWFDRLIDAPGAVAKVLLIP